MIPNTQDKVFLPFDNYIKNGAQFSSEAYKIACEAKLQKEPCAGSGSNLERGGTYDSDR